jgi:hypothetical protein
MTSQQPRTENPREVLHWRKNISTDSVTVASTSDYISFAATAHTKVYGAALAQVGDLGNPAFRWHYYVRAIAADSAYDNAYVHVEGIPVGAIITRLDLYGHTAADVNNVVDVYLERYKYDSIVAGSMADLTIENGTATASETTILLPTIDADYRYLFRIDVKSTASVENSYFTQLKVTYTSDNAQQV